MRIVPLERGMLRELRILCNLSLERDFISDNTIHRCTFGDPNFDPGFALIAREDGKMTGALIGVRRTSQPPEMVESSKQVAWIKFICALPGRDMSSVLDALFREFEERVRAEEKTTIRFSDFASWHLSPGMDVLYERYLRFLLSRGFVKEGEAVDYELDLLGFHVPKRVSSLKQQILNQGVDVRRPKRGEERKISDWVKRGSPTWAYETSQAFRFDHPKVWIAEAEDEVIGFSVWGALEPHWFGPIGVNPERRKKGIGTVLLYETLNSMRLEGLRAVTIPWTGHLFFYTQLPGIRRVRHYWILKKQLL